MWSGQCLEFSRHFQVIAPDFSGYGKSPAPQEPFRHREDMFGLIQHLGLKSLTVVGCSLGGRVAIEMAITNPGDVDRLILVAPGLAGYEYRDKETLAEDMKLEGLIAAGRHEAVADMLVDIWVVGLKRKKEMVNAGVAAFVRQMILDNYDSVIDKYPEASPGFDMISCLDKISVDTLVIVGDSDLPDMQAISKLVAGSISGARLSLMSDAGHLPNLEHDGVFNRTVADFLGLDPAAPK
jgi:pimeloyl-ACP methyl ester carboxylesterase